MTHTCRFFVLTETCTVGVVNLIRKHRIIPNVHVRASVNICTQDVLAEVLSCLRAWTSSAMLALVLLSTTALAFDGHMTDI